MSQATALLSAPDRPDIFPDNALYEVIDGQYVELPSMGVRESHIANRLARKLGNHAESEELGHVETEVLFKLFPNRDRKRRPDLAFVSFERWPKDRPIPDMAAWEVVPDLTVEVVSPTDLAMDLMDRVEDFLQAGVKWVWVVYRTLGVVHVYDSQTSITIKRVGDDLDGADVLPGFRISLADLLKVAGEGPTTTTEGASP